MAEYAVTVRDSGERAMSPAPEPYWERTSREIDESVRGKKNALPEGTITSFASLATGRSGDVELERRFLGVLDRAYQLWCDRQKKYGRRNIAAFGAVGCLVRGNDKFARLSHFYLDDAKENFIDESITDSWLDALNYSAMGLMCHERKWDDAPRPR